MSSLNNEIYWFTSTPTDIFEVCLQNFFFFSFFLRSTLIISVLGLIRALMGPSIFLLILSLLVTTGLNVVSAGRGSSACTESEPSLGYVRATGVEVSSVPYLTHDSLT